MTDKRYQLRQEDLEYPIYSDLVDTEDNDRVICTFNNDSQINKMVVLLNEQDKRIKELEKDVDYWKQVASQYSNELNVFEHCKKYKTKCKDIYWSSDVK